MDPLVILFKNAFIQGRLIFDSVMISKKISNFLTKRIIRRDRGMMLLRLTKTMHIKGKLEFFYKLP